jgi:bifunctional DNA-binding transcriptional regulator/antitoxin component of YhaV-PrlF toxin-antitoxin module
MLAKITSKNQLTLPKAVTQAVGAAEYYEVEARSGQIVLTPVRIQRGDAVRAKLAELNLSEADVAEAVAWARRAPAAAAGTKAPRRRRA